MKHEIALNGCAPTPLAHYLKALGILRLVAEQKDLEVTGFWKNESFVMKTTLDKDALLRFFLEEYQPTPIVTPWNGRGGFLEGEDENNQEDDNASSRKGAQMVALYTGEIHSRFEPIRTALLLIAANKSLSTLNICRSRYKIAKAELDRKKKAKLSILETEKEYVKQLENQIKATKRTLLQSLRNELSGSMLEWFDACQIVAEKLFQAPLLGTGGLDGSMDFGVNYLERLSCVLNVSTGKPQTFSDLMLEESLFASPTAMIPNWIPGQFAPGNMGAPNSSTGFSGISRDNHWNFLLILEGTLLLATATTRRLQNDTMGALSYPFTVRATGSGSGSNNQADEANARAEIWLPLWRNAATLAELKVLFQEGRATVGRRPARDGLDFARAVAGLGVDRGINEFQRYGFVMRSGKAYLATPFGRIQTRRNPAADLMQNLDKNRFLDNLRSFAGKAEAPGRIVALTRQLENRLFELTRRDHSTTLQDILILLGRLQRVLSISPKGREAVRVPVPLLAPEWIWKADDGSTEFRLACALASLTAPSLPIRVHFSPIDARKYDWDKESRLAVWGEGSFERNMTALLRTRLLAAERLQHQDKPFDFHFGANSSDIAAYLDDSLDDSRIGDLAQGLALVKEFPRHHDGTSNRRKESVLPGAYTLMKPFFVTDKILHRLEFLPQDRKLPQPDELLTWLAAGQSQRAVDLAWATLRHAGIALPASPQRAPSALGIDGERLLAALAIPIEYGQLAFLLRRIRHESAQIELTT
ncbi:type I-G CRISPR-associated protein Cas8g1/Csx17 [Methylosarcina fibrata]|uniref:type I-G CRISPR-associated protein Cas8g1/Csx17 n=1 Tax=Methylosarcina fibrata TaxID=105972 RepID=UPI0003A84E5A|nr:type I-U CRISPR-associated protein Csx17 [Methylosarcina fibrata]